MALLLCESFDGVETPAQMEGALKKWPETSGSISNISLVPGRTGRGRQGTGAFCARSFAGAATPARVIFGFALKFAALPDTNNTTLVACIQTGRVLGLVLSEFGLGLLMDGRLAAKHVGGSTLATAPVGTELAPDTWYFIEMDLPMSATANVIVRVNEVVVINATGNTRPEPSGTLTWDRLAIRPANLEASTPIIDDVYAVDTTGAFANKFLGDTVVECIRPDGNGDLNEWVNADGNSVNNFSFVNERNIDPARYVESITPGDRDLYEHQDLAASFGALAGVQVTCDANHLSDAAPMNMALLSREGASEDQSSGITLALAQTTFSRIFHTDPDAAQWTRDKVNASQFGVRTVAP